MICKYCGSSHLHKDGRHNEFQRYKCVDCRKSFDGELYTTKYIEHFGVRIKDKPTNRLTRDNYCTPTNKTEPSTRRTIERAEFYERNNIKIFMPSCYKNLPNAYFVDKDHYTDSWVKQQYEDCMYNYDLNIKYFNSLDKEEFNKRLDVFIKKNKMTQIFDLNNAKIRGVYLLVLDEYKQVYIGISDDIKRRVVGHWNHRKEFSRLIYGSKEDSVLSVDSFGALDTTRIYIKELKRSQDINAMEEEMVSRFDAKYTLNRIMGGLNSDLPDFMRLISAIGSAKRRNLGAS